MSTKRFRRPKLKDGELRMYWGKLPHDSPNVVLAWQGDSSMKRDTNLLHYVMCSQKPKVNVNTVDWSQMQPSLIEELKARGYDITTLQFSIRKRATAEPAKESAEMGQT